MEQSPNRNSLDYHYHGNTDHKLEVLGLVTDNEHSYKHCNTAAERRENEQGLFGGTKLNAVLFGDLLVVNANDNGNYRYYRDIRQKYGESEIVLYEF